MALFERFRKPKSETEVVGKPSVTPKQEKPEAAKAEPKKEVKPKAEKGEKKTAKKEKKSRKEVSTKKTSVTPQAARLGIVLSKPVITEKATILAEKGTYVFFVDASTNKIQIKQAIRAVYGFTPAHVRITNQKGKVVRFGRYEGKRVNRKKAYVTLKKGDKIDLSA